LPLKAITSGSFFKSILYFHNYFDDIAIAKMQHGRKTKDQAAEAKESAQCHWAANDREI
jgi:hypothetical protein